MDWTDEGIVIGARRHGESSAILETMTRMHGRHLGLVRGGRSSRLAPVLQPGNGVRLHWRARLDEHLGNFTVEAMEFRAGRLMESSASLHGLAYLCALLRLLPEREPDEGLHAAACVLLDHLGEAAFAAAMTVRFEIALLGKLGFGLDLSACAATGATQELVYVSPRSGRAVSARAGAPYADRLLPLPSFARSDFIGEAVTAEEVAAGFALTGHFLAQQVFEPRGLSLPDERAAFLRAALSQAKQGDAPAKPRPD